MTTKKNELNHGHTVPRRHALKRWLLYGQLAVILMFNLRATAQLASADAWPRFRGSDGSGVISGAGLPDDVSALKPALLWTKDVGNGFSEVSVKNNTAYIQSGDTLRGGNEYVAALDAATGEELWKTKLDTLWIEIDGWGHGPRSTPAIGDEMLFCLSGCGKFSALQISDGAVVWSVSLIGEFGARTPRWGFSTSPVIVGDEVILETGGTDNRAVTAFDKKTGEIRWSKGIGPASYCSPAQVTLEGRQQLVYALDSMLYAYDPQGNELWNYRIPFRAPIAMPVFIAPDKFFVTSEGNAKSCIVQVQNRQASEVMTGRTMLNNWSSSCYRDGYLYGFSRAKLICMSVETGKMVWGQRGFGKGSLIILDDKLVILSDQGELVIAEATPQQYTELQRQKVMEGRSWTAPSFADGKLYVRNLTTMSCYDLTNTKSL